MLPTAIFSVRSNAFCDCAVSGDSLTSLTLVFAVGPTQLPGPKRSTALKMHILSPRRLLNSVIALLSLNVAIAFDRMAAQPDHLLTTFEGFISGSFVPVMMAMNAVPIT